MLGELTEEQMENLLMSQVLGRIGFHHEGKTHILPITYAYDGWRVICHTGEGHKIRAMRADCSVCFEVEQVDSLVNWRSVVVQGTFQELKGYEATIALGFLVQRIAPLIASCTTKLGEQRKSISPHPRRKEQDSAENMIVFAIRVHEKSGRFEKQ